MRLSFLLATGAWALTAQAADTTSSASAASVTADMDQMLRDYGPPDGARFALETEGSSCYLSITNLWGCTGQSSTPVGTIDPDTGNCTSKEDAPIVAICDSAHADLHYKANKGNDNVTVVAEYWAAGRGKWWEELVPGDSCFVNASNQTCVHVGLRPGCDSTYNIKTIKWHQSCPSS